jgi:hypothetical protein
MPMRRFAIGLFLALCGALALPAVRGQEETPAQVGVTFFGWADQHVSNEGSYEHCLPSVEAMKALPGTAYPDAVGGGVEEPAFVLSAGDLTEWPTHAATEGYLALVKLLPWPTHEIAGNHDNGGDAPSDTMLAVLREKHGGLDYSFDAGGVHFTCLYTPLAPGATTPEGPIFDETLDFLREDLAKLTEDQPVIVVMHHCADSLTNKDALLEALAGKNVLAVLGGHYHKAVKAEVGGVPFYQLPSPKSDQPAVTAIRVTSDRLSICTWGVREGAWLEGLTLDVPIRGPVAEVADGE